jgi:ABC-type antimicrobial peptide transport system permease subunit
MKYYIKLYIIICICIAIPYCGACATNNAADIEQLEIELRKQAANIGDNILNIYERDEVIPDSERNIDHIKLQDAEEISKQYPVIQYVSQSNMVGSIIEYQGRKAGDILGITPPYLSIFEWQISQGSMFSDVDDKEANKVCVLGNAAAKNLFNEENALGKSVSLIWITSEDRKPSDFRVIGVLKEKGPTIGGSVSWNNVVFVPLNTVLQLANNDRKSFGSLVLSVKVINREKVPEAIKKITEVLRKQHKIEEGKPDDFIIKDMNKSIEDEIKQIIQVKKTYPGGWKNVKIPPDAGIKIIEEEVKREKTGDK